MTWARQTAPESQQAISEAYVSIGRELGATVVPVGATWQGFLRKHDWPVLYDRDQSHPSLAGSFLAASVFFAVLMKESPAGIDITVPELDREDVALLQRAAWRGCKGTSRRSKK
jgi:hypothetical protein